MKVTNNLLENMSPIINGKDSNSAKVEHSSVEDEVISSNVEKAPVPATTENNTPSASHQVNSLLNRNSILGGNYNHSLKYATKAPTVQNLFLAKVNSHVDEEITAGSPLYNLKQIVNDAKIGSRQGHESVANVLNELGQLGTEQQNILLQSEKVIAQGLEHLDTRLDGLNDNSQIVTSLPDQQLQFSVSTQEGDIVTIDFNQLQQGSFALQYEVEGELSESEKVALAGLYEEFSKFSQSFFSSEKRKEISSGINIADSFDSSVLKGFNIAYSGNNPEKNETSLIQSTNRDVLNYSYQVNQNDNSQSLNFQIDFSDQTVDFGLTTSLTGSYNEGTVSAYIEEARNNLGSHLSQISSNASNEIDNDEKVSDTNFSLFSQSFTSMFQTQTSENKDIKTGAAAVNEINDKNSSGVQGTISAHNQEISSLADFELSFVLNKESQFSMGQQTQIDKNSEGSTINQRRYTSTTTNISPLDSAHFDPTKPRNQYVTTYTENNVQLEVDNENQVLHFSLDEKSSADTFSLGVTPLSSQNRLADSTITIEEHQQSIQITVENDEVIESFQDKTTSKELYSASFWNGQFLDLSFSYGISQVEMLNQTLVKNLSSDQVVPEIKSSKVQRYIDVGIMSFDPSKDSTLKPFETKRISLTQ